MERKLAAILAADVVGYSALMERDEAGTFERLKARRKEIFEPEVEKHHGRIFKLTGDGVLVEFTSVVDAVECAVSVQRGMAERNASVPSDQRMDIRIGINLGEVIVEDDDCYGEGVNIAARLQQLADPGGICVSGKVTKEVENKLAFGFEPMGMQKVKNIAEPIAVFRVKLDGGRIWPTTSFTAKRLWPWAAAIAAVGVLAVGWFTVMKPAEAPVSSDIPSLAVLPFGNMSGDPGQDHLGPGVADDIITVLSTLPTIRVVSRMSSFIYDKPVKVQQVAQDLGVSYVVEGSVKKSAGKVRVTAQLINAVTGDHVWANRFDKEGDVLTIEEDVANAIFDTLAGPTGEIRKDEERRAWSKAKIDLGEYDYYLRGHQYFFRWTGEDIARAREIFREGLTKFPDSSLLRIKVAATYCNDIMNERSDDPMRDVADMDRLLDEAKAGQNKSQLEAWLLHHVSACKFRLEGKFERTAAEAEAAARLVPYDAFSHIDLADFINAAGKPEQAVQWAEDAMKRDQNGADWWHDVLAFAYYNAGRSEEAIAEFGRRKEPCNDCMILAAAYTRLGKIEEARKIITAFREKYPDWTVQKEAVWPTGQNPLMNEPYLAAYLADVAKAGLPEK